MSVIAQRVWREPAVFIGLLVTIALAVAAVIAGADWDAETIIGILAPLASALGIRRAVSPAAGPRLAADEGAVPER